MFVHFFPHFMKGIPHKAEIFAKIFVKFLSNLNLTIDCAKENC